MNPKIFEENTDFFQKKDLQVRNSYENPLIESREVSGFVFIMFILVVYISHDCTSKELKEQIK